MNEQRNGTVENNPSESTKQLVMQEAVFSSFAE
jgi:hypothetical protein